MWIGSREQMTGLIFFIKNYFRWEVAFYRSGVNTCSIVKPFLFQIITILIVNDKIENCRALRYEASGTVNISISTAKDTDCCALLKVEF